MQARVAEVLEELKSGNLAPPDNGYSERERMDLGLVINRVGDSNYTVRIKAIRVDEKGQRKIEYHPYGYMTPQEIAMGRVKNIVNRTVPASHLAKWEKEKGYPYIGSAVVLNMVRSKRDSE